ncbi:DUF992 domain-containing protein [Chenggangzhangella methanolivorans]|uniref:DUF992 domain-containing protein n=1 Tax=Chenggangzhangella methanolivorans TaxID=1437009 RepID=UPI003D17B06C
MTLLIRSALAAAALSVAAFVLPAVAADDAHPFVTIKKVGRSYEPVSGYQVGTLRCEIPGGIGYIVGSRRDVSCEYRPNVGRNAVDLYMGHMNKIGVDVGKTGLSVLAWAVVAPFQGSRPGRPRGQVSRRLGERFGAHRRRRQRADRRLGHHRLAPAAQRRGPDRVVGRGGLFVAHAQSDLTLLAGS